MRNAKILAAILFLAPAVSRAGNLEDLLVEKGVITRSEAKSATGSEMAAPKIYYSDGTRIEFPDGTFSTRINTLIQGKYQFTDNDSDLEKANVSSFDVVRARIIIQGNALSKEFAYYLQGDFVGSRDDGRKEADLRDAYIDWMPVKDSGFRMGQYKTFVSRQFVNSDHKLQFIDRTDASNYFDEGRQAGLSAYMDFPDGAGKIAAGIFNGESDGEGFNFSGVDTDHTGMLSVRFNPIGKIDAYEEGDINHSEDVGVSLGAAYSFAGNENDLEAGAGLEEIDNQTVSVDANLKVQGLGLHTEFFWKEAEPESIEKSEPLGGYIQAGYFILPKELEVAARYGIVDCDDGKAEGSCAGQEQLDQASATINYSWIKYSLRAQLGFEYFNKESASDTKIDENGTKWMLQLTSYL